MSQPAAQDPTAQAPTGQDPNAIAIVGAGCRFPGGVTDPESLWQLVHGRIDAVTQIPPTRWDVDKHLDANPSTPGKMYTNRGGFIDDVERFDAEFFGINPREAQSIDPQQRLLLETAYEALESAAIAPDSLAGTLTGVFVGAPSPDFGYRLQELPSEKSTIYQVNGTGFHAAAGRLSYMFGLVGPSVAIDTACSTSLVAIHLACQSLQTGESDVALAGGANVLLGPYGAVLFCQGQLLAPDGACKTFDADANGFVRSEGCAVLVLKRLADAQRDQDPIIGVIRGSAVNSDGRSAGLTQPFGPAQEAVVRAALKRASLAPADIDYVETHGTGTPTGDPIEVLALANVLGQDRHPDRKLVLGSIKTNIGHPEAASGAAGLLKVVMALQHEEIPANLHFSTPNPRVDWDRHPVQVAATPLPWKRDDARPRRAGISSFGFSGTNAHVIVEQAPTPPVAATPEAGPCLVPLSARTPAALAELAQRHADHLAANPDIPFADAVLTLSAGREHHRERVAFVAETAAELQAGLEAIAAGALPPGAAATPDRKAAAQPRIAFLFTGQGAQYAGMGRDLYDREPVFRTIVDRAAAILDPLLDHPFRDVLFGAADFIDETAYTQPALYTLEYGIATLWRAWGITPSALLGHSIGELAAAAIAGVFSFEDGLRLVAARGRLMQALPRDGAMAAIFAPEAETRAAIAPFARLTVAGINGPDETVISGDRDALDQALATFDAQAIRTRRLDVSHAFHSPLLDPMLDEFEAVAATIDYAPPEIELLSNVTGQPFPPGTAPDAAYWRRHAREAVRFGPAVAALAAHDIDLLVEVGPAPILLALAARCAPTASWTPVPSLRRAKDGQPAADLRQMLTAARDLYVRGADLRFAAMPPARTGRRRRLPTYPFQRVRHWMLDSQRTAAPAKRTGHSLLGDRQLGPGSAIAFLAELSADDPAYIAQHVIHGAAIMPGAGFLEMMFAAGRAIGFDHEIRLERVTFERPLEFDEARRRHVHTNLVPDGDGYHLTIASAPADAAPAAQQWVQHASARLSAGPGRGTNTAPDLAEARDRVTEPYDIGLYYRDTVDIGVDLGPAFRVIQAEYKDGPNSVARLQLQLPPEDSDPLLNIHPTMLDGILQVAGSQVPKGDWNGAYLPLGIDEIVLHRKAPDAGWASVNLTEIPVDTGVMRSDLRLEDDQGTLIVSVTGLTNQRVAAETLAGGIATQALSATWEPAPAAQPRIPALDLVLLPDTAGFAERLALAVTAGGGKAVLAADTADAVARIAAAPAATLLDCRALDPVDDRDAPADTERAYLGLLALAQALSAKAPTAPLCVLTQGAVVAAPGDEPSIAAAALAGLIRTLLVEQTAAPRLHLDLERGPAPDLRTIFAALAILRPEEPAGALRHGAVRIQRLRLMAPPHPPSQTERTVLDIAIRGDFDNLRFERRPRQQPAPNEIEIEIRASGLNFRDLVNALGMYPAPVPPLGSECAGIVTAIGTAITDLKPGDEVVAIAPESFASHCLCPRALAVRKPGNVSFAEAVTIPNAYLTAQLCLDVAGIQPGQRILVHAAAGGVGSALLRLAKIAGLEIFATAGNDEKRAWARARGATHVFDSRTTAFASQIMDVTNGEGVDLVVNSLAGEFIEAGLRIVRPGGCFVEIGKQGLWTEAEAEAVAPGVRYRVEDLGRELLERPEAFIGRQERLMDWIAQGLIDPLPVRVFPLSAVKDAFRHMAAARHIGKIVLTPDEWAAPLPIRADGTYVVTGGFGGVGLLVVRWLLAKGAGHVAILGRQGAAGRQDLLAELDGGAGRVSAFACDVGDRDALAQLWQTGLAALPPIRGIFHAAGVLDDAPVESQDPARFTRVKRPKADGAWNLHELSRGEPLDCFVLFSSTAATFGSPGQANYAAANGFLDGLAASRRYHGLPATSIAWGPWADVGMAAGMTAQQATWARAGIGLISPESGIAALDTILSSPAAHATVLALNLRLATRKAGPEMQRLLGAKAQPARRAGEPAARSGISATLAALKALADQATQAERQAALAAYLEDEIARVLGFESGSLDLVTPLPELGLDSLMAVQVRNSIIAQLAVDLPVRELLGGSNVAQLAELLAQAWADRSTPETPRHEEAALVEEGTL